MVDSIGSPLSAANAAHQLSLPQGLKAPKEGASMVEIERVAKQMEGVFFSMFVKEMRKTMTDGSLFGDGPGAETYEGFFDQMMGEHLGRSGGLGIAEMVVRNTLLSRERITIEELQESMNDPQIEKSKGAIPLDQVRENDDRTKTKKPERSRLAATENVAD